MRPPCPLRPPCPPVPAVPASARRARQCPPCPPVLPREHGADGAPLVRDPRQPLTCKISHKMRHVAYNLRPSSHRRCADSPPPAPASPRWGCATWERGLARALNARERNTHRARDRRTLCATRRGSAHLLCDKRRRLCATRCRFRCGAGALYVHSYNGVGNPCSLPASSPATPHDTARRPPQPLCKRAHTLTRARSPTPLPPTRPHRPRSAGGAWLTAPTGRHQGTLRRPRRPATAAGTHYPPRPYVPPYGHASARAAPGDAPRHTGRRGHGTQRRPEPPTWDQATRARRSPMGVPSCLMRHSVTP